MSVPMSVFLVPRPTSVFLVFPRRSSSALVFPLPLHGNCLRFVVLVRVPPTCTTGGRLHTKKERKEKKRYIHLSERPLIHYLSRHSALIPAFHALRTFNSLTSFTRAQLHAAPAPQLAGRAGSAKQHRPQKTFLPCPCLCSGVLHTDEPLCN